MSLKKHKWIAKDGSVFVDHVVEKRNRDFNVKYNVREAIAFNVGQEMAEYIVKLHNTVLEMKHATGS